MFDLKDFEKSLEDLQRIINYQFKDIDFLKRALTSTQYANEHSLDNCCHNDALSTLGDAVQDVIVMNEAIASGISSKGYLTKAKGAFADNDAQDYISMGFKLYEYVRWGKGETQDKKWTKTPSVHEKVFEALIGAIFLDGGLNAAEQCFWRMYSSVHTKLSKVKDSNFKPYKMVGFYNDFKNNE